MKFATVLTCIDGRVQKPVYDYLAKRFETPWIDTITEPAIVSVLAGGEPQAALSSVLQRLDISISAHGSTELAVVAHHDCAANQIPDATQHQQLRGAFEFLQNRYPSLEIITLWVDDKWAVEERPASEI